MTRTITARIWPAAAALTEVSSAQREADGAEQGDRGGDFGEPANILDAQVVSAGKVLEYLDARSMVAGHA